MRSQAGSTLKDEEMSPWDDKGLAGWQMHRPLPWVSACTAALSSELREGPQLQVLCALTGPGSAPSGPIEITRSRLPVPLAGDRPNMPDASR